MLQTLKTTYSKPLTASQIALKHKALPSHSFSIDDSIQLECGETLDNLTLSYSTYGQLNSDASNVVWVCHALTANSEVADWWPGMIGKGKLLDPSQHFIVCAFCGSQTEKLLSGRK